MKSTQITAFLESIFTNEAFHHEIEHRIFESEPWKSLENDPEIEVEAFAYSTGILFRIRSFHLPVRDIIDAFFGLAEELIPNLSITEEKRFIKEVVDREKNRMENFDEWAGEEFLKKFESAPIIPKIEGCRKLFSRMSFVVSDTMGIRYEEKRFFDSTGAPSIVEGVSTLENSDAYHLFQLHPIPGARELVASTIFSNIIRERLRRAFRDTGDSYDIHLSLHYERNFLYSDYFWRSHAEGLQLGDLGVFRIPTQEEFAEALKQSYFFARIGHEDGSFGLNVTLSIPPKAELDAYEEMTYEAFNNIITKNPLMIWGCGSQEMGK